MASLGSVTNRLRTGAALLAGAAAAEASRRLGRGGGTALPGLVAATIAPDITEQLVRRAGAGTVVVTGTNGKTTTAHLLAEIARAAGIEVIANRSGSNLERGIVSAFLGQSTNGGGAHLGVLEVDEAALPPLLPALRPRAIVFLNLFRDQLDRYGEVDSVAEGWERMLIADTSGATLVLNADDPSIAPLADAGRGELVTFGIEDDGIARGGPDHASDARFCRCGAAFRYDAIFVAHAGRWRCDACGRTRPRPLVAAHEIEELEDGSRFVLDLAGERLAVELPLQGLYPIYNALGAAAAAHALGLPAAVVAGALAAAGPAFGRQERFELRGRELRLWLAKNPAGMNAVLRALTASGTSPEAGPEPRLHILAALNDGIQDGRDVSWIYDADFELLAGHAASVVVSGDRADDLALRLRLAGVPVDLVQPHRASALDEALHRLPPGERLEVIATYTAMIQLREIIAAASGIAPYWATERKR